MKQECSCGVIVFHCDENKHIQFLLVQGYGNFWGFPMGHPEHNETQLETALRELQEEAAVREISILPNLRFGESYVIEKRRGPNVFKKAIYFVGQVSAKKAQRQKSEVRQLGWFNFEHAKDLVVPDKKIILNEVYRKILE